MSLKIGIVGLGYVGLPVALAFAKKFPGSVGFDINKQKVKDLREGKDVTGEVPSSALTSTSLRITDEIEELKTCNFYVVAVPTPVDVSHRPDLTPVVKASESVGKILKRGDIVVYESTVYPGVTEDICGPILEKVSGLRQSKDFKLGYSPERINPGDKERTIEKIVKIVSGEDKETLERVSYAYGQIIEAGVYNSPSIKVAEAAKVIENTQRDLNIALMNELALIFDRLGIRTVDVLEAAGTKWNFLPFRPGLVGGHCIGVDPYYLTAKAEELGYLPQVILSGRRINDGMGAFVAQKTVKMLTASGTDLTKAKVGILGITFKENITDIRNSRLPDIVAELKEYGIQAKVWDPHADHTEVLHEYSLELAKEIDLRDLDALIVGVAHKEFVEDKENMIFGRLKNRNSLIIDIKSMLSPEELESRCRYWSL